MSEEQKQTVSPQPPVSNDQPITRRAESIIEVTLILGYAALTIIALLNWHEDISVALVTGFVLYVQQRTSRQSRGGSQ